MPTATLFPLLRYGVAVLSVVLALLLTLLLWPLMEPNRFLLLSAAVMFSSWYGGLRPGLLATLCAVLGDFFFFPAAFSPVDGFNNILRLGLLVLVSLLIGSLSEARKRAQEALRKTHDELEKRVNERTAELAKANEELQAEIIERKRVENSLRQSEARFRRVIESNIIGIGFWDVDGKITDANDALLEIVGYSREDLLSGRMKWKDMTPEEYTHLDDRVIDDLRTFGQCTPFEKEYIRKDGSRVPVLIGGALLEGSLDSGVFFALDITERKRAEEEHTRFISEQIARAEAEDSQRWSRFLSEASSELSASLDYETTLKNVARLAVPTLADYCFFDVVTEDEKIERVAWAHIDPAQQELADNLWRHIPPQEFKNHPSAKMLSTGKTEFVPEVTDVWMQAAATSPAHLQLMRDLNFHSLMTVPLVARERNLGALTFCLVDRSRHYTAIDFSLTEELARRAALAVDNALLYRKAQQANRAKDEFLATASHELRTPLASMLIWVRMLGSGKLDEETSAQALSHIAGNVKSLSLLINDLLDVSRIITGKLRIDARPIELLTVINAAVDVVRPAAESKTIEIKTALDPSAGSVLGDPDRLQQVLWNLLSNAIKFTPVEGSIEIRLERKDSNIQITVSDTGQGINPKCLPHIFERFYQVNEKNEHRGLGLGLAIVRHLVEMQGGTVDVESPGEGQGATFKVKLPLLAVRLEENDLERIQSNQ